MKKIIVTILVIAMLLSLAACGSKDKDKVEDDSSSQTEQLPEDTQEPQEDTDKEPEDDTAKEPEEKPADKQPEQKPEEKPADDAGAQQGSDLMTKLESLIAGINEEMRVMNQPVPTENFEYFTFIPYVEGYEAVASQAAIGSIAHSVVLLHVPEGTDAAAVAAEIDTNKDPRWLVCVEAESSWVKTSGQYILLVMSDAESADIIANNFSTVFGG